MKRIVALAIALVSAATLSAQSAQKVSLGRTSIEGRLGGNLAIMSSSMTNMTPIFTLRVGIGLEQELKIAGLQFSFETGLYYTGKGATFDQTINYKLRIDYLQLPLVVSYRFQLPYGIRLKPYLGWYFATGLSGIATTSLGEASIPAFNYSGMWLKRGDNGLMLGAKVEWQKFSLALGYELGVADLSRSGTLRNHCITLTLGYRIADFRFF